MRLHSQLGSPKGSGSVSVLQNFGILKCAIFVTAKQMQGLSRATALLYYTFFSEDFNGNK